MRTQRTLCNHCLEPLRRGRLITDRQLGRRETTNDWCSDEYVDLVAFKFLDISVSLCFPLMCFYPWKVSSNLNRALAVVSRLYHCTSENSVQGSPQLSFLPFPVFIPNFITDFPTIPTITDFPDSGYSSNSLAFLSITV